MDSYKGQDRGAESSYEAYYRSMDKSMRQKVALISSYFPVQGRIADMGSGSGSGSFDLASLFPDLEVIGVDINPKSVEYSAQHYHRPNLSYAVGDIADPVFPSSYLDGILNSSVLHHVTSFNGFSTAKLETLLDHQVSMLKEEGVLAIRDFVVPDGPETVRIELPTSDGDSVGDDPETVSTARLFEIFCRDFRSSLNRMEPVQYRKLGGTRAGWEKFEVSMRAATEFLLRKNYRKDWVAELLEEYLYYTQSQFEGELKKRGMRLIVSKQIFNPWIVANRFVGKFHWVDAATGRDLPYPPTNYVIVAVKGPEHEGVELVEKSSEPRGPTGYLRIESFDDSKKELKYDLVSRPQPTVDLIPWFETNNGIWVLCRSEFPRPILNIKGLEENLDQTRVSGYITEPIAGVVGQSGTKITKDEAELLFVARSGVDRGQILKSEAGLSYFPSPGAIGERADSFFLKLHPPESMHWSTDWKSGFKTGFSAPNKIRSLHVQQTLRAYQIGGMMDSRLELNLYELLLRLNRKPEAWIGATLPDVTPQSPRLSSLDDAFVEDRKFIRTDNSTGFLSVRQARFLELDRAGRRLAEKELEYVVPSTRLNLTVVLLPYAKLNDGDFALGLQIEHLPALQHYGLDGRSTHLTFPGWRLEKRYETQEALTASLRERMRTEFKTEIPADLIPLGGDYSPSPGLVPERVSLFAVPVATPITGNENLIWIRMSELLAKRSRLRSGHLLTALFRFWCASLG